MSCEDVLDRSIEKRAQAGGDLLARHAFAEPLVLDPKALPEVGQRVSGDNGTLALDPEHDVVVLPAGEDLDLERKLVAPQVEVAVAALPEPAEVGTAVSGLLGGDAELVDQVLRRVNRRRVDGEAEPLEARTPPRRRRPRAAPRAQGARKTADTAAAPPRSRKTPAKARSPRTRSRKETPSE